MNKLPKMQSVAKSEIWKKVNRRAEKLKRNVAKKMQPSHQTSVTRLSSEEDEGIYEDLSSHSSTPNNSFYESEYSFADPGFDPSLGFKSASSYYDRTSRSCASSPVHPFAPNNNALLQHELKDYHLKASSLTRNVSPAFALKPTAPSTARSWQDLTVSRPSHNNEKELRQNVLYRSVYDEQGTSSEEDSYGTSPVSEPVYSVARKNPAATHSEYSRLDFSLQHQARVQNLVPSPNPRAANIPVLSTKVKPHSSCPSSPMATLNRERDIRRGRSAFEEEPIFGTINKDHVNMVRNSTSLRFEAGYEEESIYHETENPYDFE